MIDAKGGMISMNFSHMMEHGFAKFEIAPTKEAQMAWELFRKYPYAYALEPSYIIKKEENGVIREAELVEISLVPRGKREQDITRKSAL